MSDDHDVPSTTDIILTNIDDKKECIKTANMKHQEEYGEQSHILENVCGQQVCKGEGSIEVINLKPTDPEQIKSTRSDSIINNEIDDRKMSNKQRQTKFDWIYDNHVCNEMTSQQQGFSHNQTLPPEYLLDDQHKIQEDAILRNYQYYYEQNLNHQAHFPHNHYYNAAYGAMPGYQGYGVPYPYYDSSRNASKFKQSPLQEEDTRAFDPMVFFAEDSEVERKYMKKSKPKSTLKPPYSYSQLITKAIEESENGILTLSEIYKYIKNSFEYYNKADNTWQNSIRHNLSLNKVFKKVARPTNKPGKGGYWTIDYDYIANGTPYKRYRRKSDPQSYNGNQASIPSGNQHVNGSCTAKTDNQSIESSSESEKRANNRM